MIGFAALASSGNEVANEVFVVPDIVPTLAATPTATVGPATASPSPSPDAVLDGVGSEEEASAVDDDLAIVETDELSVERLAGAERVICDVFYDADCSVVLAVASCESGSDYWAPIAKHAGTFQLRLDYHGWRFLGYGWDPWTEADDIYKNAVVAHDLWLAKGREFWPTWSCG